MEKEKRPALSRTAPSITALLAFLFTLYAATPAWALRPLPISRSEALALQPEKRLLQYDAGPTPAHERPETITFEGMVIESDLRLMLNDELLIVRNCTFNGASLKVRGNGDVLIEECTFNQPLTLGVMIMIDGTVEIDSIYIYGAGASPNYFPYSGLTIHGATRGGRISEVYVENFLGNGVLVEEALEIKGLELTDIEVHDCSGGIWFFNAKECYLDGFHAFDSNYRPRGYSDEPLVFPCVRDAWYVEGERVRGDTEVGDVVCE